MPILESVTAPKTDKILLTQPGSFTHSVQGPESVNNNRREGMGERVYTTGEDKSSSWSLYFIFILFKFYLFIYFFHCTTWGPSYIYMYT